MILNNIDNLNSFGYSILTGILAGIIYDLFKAFRYAKAEKKRFKYIGDLVFWGIITIGFFIIMAKVSDGLLRGFLFIGFFGGGSLYLLTLSNWTFPIFLNIFKLIIQLFNEIIRIVKIPFRKMKIKIRLKNFLLARKEMKESRKRQWKLIRRKK